METTTIKADDYSIVYDADEAMITCQGSLLLSGTEEYAPILNLLSDAADNETHTLTIDIRQLEFLNSSGINTMTKFVINVRNNKKDLKLTALGYEDTPWQVRLLKNLQRLMPDLVLHLESAQS